jgi:heptosyltransferase-2
MTPLNALSIKRIVVRSANWVGDAIMTTPALHTLRYHFPAAHITLLAKPWVIPVFEHNPDVDDIMVFQTGNRHKGHIGLWRLTRDMRRQHFDMALLLQNAFEAALLAYLALIPSRVGFTTDGRGLLLTHRIGNWRPLKKGHLVDYYLGLLAGAGIPAVDRKLTLVVTPQEHHEALERIAQWGLNNRTKLVGFNPGATYGTAKRWPADRFAQLGRRFIHEIGAGILIFGSDSEKNLGERIAGDIGPGCINLCGQTTLRQAMALIQVCNLFITNDSGLMHVAAALDIPQVALIGPTDPVATGPVNAASIILRDADACHQMPCMKPHCPIDHRCMTALSVDNVFKTGAALHHQTKAL